MSRKDDSGKPRWSLLPSRQLVKVVSVLEFGAKKYAPHAWQGVSDSRTRYYDAAMRHLNAWWEGEKEDQESGEPHLAHAACCIFFLMWGDDQ